MDLHSLHLIDNLGLIMNPSECQSAHRTNQHLMQLRARLELYAVGALVSKLLNEFDKSMQAIDYELFEATTINDM